MSLSGALSDLGVVDLVQLPHARRKTGELVVAVGEQEARLYYQQGKLVHAALDGLRGPPVLVQVLGWEDGRFEFHGEVAAPETSIEGDLHHTVLEALKTRDEQAEERRKAGNANSDRLPDPGLEASLASFVEANGWVLGACLLDPDGAVAAEAARWDAVPFEPGPLRQLFEGWHRAGLRRVLLEDELGIVVAVRLAGGGTLVVVAPRGEVQIGAVSMSVSKLAASLES